MHRCFRDGTFAIGLILGISLTLIFIIWSLSGLGWMWLDDPKPYSYTYTKKKCAEQKIKYGAEIPLILKGQNSKTARYATENTNASKQNNPEQPNWCDLASQESMAKSTYWMNNAAWAALILSTLGVYLIWKTLAAGRQTLKEAKKATEAAVKTINVTRDIGEAQVRAYLHITDMVVTFYPETRVYLARAKIQNSGNSPSVLQHLVVNAHIQVGSDAYAIKIGPLKIPISAINAGGDVLTADFHLCNTDTSDCGVIANVDCDLYWGDVFGRQCQARRGFSLTRGKDGSEIVFSVPLANENEG